MKSHYNKNTASVDLLKMLKTMRIQVILTVHFQKSLVAAEETHIHGDFSNIAHIVLFRMSH